jgi:D-3-phosphoglycerate dehydrogenase
LKKTKAKGGEVSTKVLITHTLMVKERHEQQLRQAGFEIFRLKDLEASEEQLCKAVAEVDGYILGGLEHVTEKVIDAGKKLRAICTTAASWKSFIPAHEYATRQGIALVSALGANSESVAEFTVALIHERVRNLCFLSGEGQGQSYTARNFRGLTLGLIGVGKVGNKVGRIMNAAYGTKILYTSIRQNLDFEFATGATWVSLDDLLKRSDVISIHLPVADSTKGIINGNNIRLIKDGGIVINMSYTDVIESQALKRELEAGRISVASDVGYNPNLAHISSRSLLQFSNYAAYKTVDTSEVASDVVTRSMINLLTKGDDPWVVNPEFLKFRSGKGNKR